MIIFFVNDYQMVSILKVIFFKTIYWFFPLFSYFNFLLFPWAQNTLWIIHQIRILSSFFYFFLFPTKSAFFRQSTRRQLSVLKRIILYNNNSPLSTSLFFQFSSLYRMFCALTMKMFFLCCCLEFIWTSSKFEWKFLFLR